MWVTVSVYALQQHKTTIFPQSILFVDSRNTYTGVNVPNTAEKQTNQTLGL